MRARKEWLEWFRVDRDLPDHPKVIALADAAGWSQHETVGRLIAFWAWVARYAPSGRLGRSEAEAARRLGHAVDHLIGAAFIERINGDALEVRNWLAFNGHAMKERERKRSSISAEVPRAFQPISEPTVRDGTVHKKTKKEPSSAPADFELWWKTYPGGGSKAEALSQWTKLKPDPQALMAALESQISHRASAPAGAFVPEWPHGCRWLSKRRWEDRLNPWPLPIAAGASTTFWPPEVPR